MTLLSIRNEIITAIGGRTDITDLIDDQINYAVSELASMFAFDELHATKTMTTTASQFEYLLPSDLYILWGVKEETRRNKPLEYKDIRNFDNMDETQTGTPYFFSQFNKSLILFGMVPDNNDGSNYLIRIRYWQKHAILVNDNDSLVTPKEWDRGIRLKAQAFVFGLLDMEEKQDRKQKEFDRWLGRIKLPGGARKEKAKAARMNFGVGRGTR